MARTAPAVALALALAALVAAALAAPGGYLALGLGIAAVGVGWTGYRDRSALGSARLRAAGAIALGATGAVLGAVRIALTLAAIAHIDRMIAR